MVKSEKLEIVKQVRRYLVFSYFLNQLRDWLPNTYTSVMIVVDFHMLKVNCIISSQMFSLKLIFLPAAQRRPVQNSLCDQLSICEMSHLKAQNAKSAQSNDVLNDNFEFLRWSAVYLLSAVCLLSSNKQFRDFKCRNHAKERCLK